MVLAAIVLGVGITLLVSRLLSKTILKGLPSSFTLELPPYRKPQVGRIIIRSVFDRTLFVLGRAVAVAAPAGLVIWVMANTSFGRVSLLAHGARFLIPCPVYGAGRVYTDGVYTGLSSQRDSNPHPYNELHRRGYHGGTGQPGRDAAAVCGQRLDLGHRGVHDAFSLNHWPCGTTLWTIRKETQSWKWTWISLLVPTITGILLCIMAAQGARLLGIG